MSRLQSGTRPGPSPKSGPTNRVERVLKSKPYAKPTLANESAPAAPCCDRAQMFAIGGGIIIAVVAGIMLTSYLTGGGNRETTQAPATAIQPKENAAPAPVVPEPVAIERASAKASSSPQTPYARADVLFPESTDKLDVNLSTAKRKFGAPPVAVPTAARFDEAMRPGVKPNPVSTERTLKPWQRLSRLSEEDLRKQLRSMPEVVGEMKQQPILKTTSTPFSDKHPIFQTFSNESLAQLPLRMGADCEIGKEQAETMHVLSRKMRSSFESATLRITPGPGTVVDICLDAEALGTILERESKQWQRPQAVPTLMQMLSAESSDCRLLLVNTLAKIKGPDASRALAARALADLDPEVRETAVNYLKDRATDDYIETLLAAFRHPWSAYADHAAEAMLALDLRSQTPALKALLPLSDPNMATGDGVLNGKSETQEVVRINHLKNCLMCHARSTRASDLVRGAVPLANQPLPPRFSTEYYDGHQGSFVRGDITYLRQDFSVVQPVEKPGNWPSHQRFDYVVRIRPATLEETLRLARSRGMAPQTYPQREAVQFVLRGFTARDEAEKSASK